MKQQSGFTLIELIMVIVILGILAVTAMPKFTSMKEEASRAALAGVAGALTSGTAINYAMQSLHFGSGVKVLNCTHAESALEGQTLPTGYAITASTLAASIVSPLDGTNSKYCRLDYNGQTTYFQATGSN